MKKFILLLPLAFYLQICVSQSQSLDRSVIGAGGNSLAAENVILSFTIGETAVSTVNTSSLIVAEGFQQSGIQELISGTDEIIFINNLQPYPNPTKGLLYLGANIEDQFEFSVALYDILGKRIDIQPSASLNDNKYQLDLSGLPVGAYHLQVELGGNQIRRVFKVLKVLE